MIGQENITEDKKLLIMPKLAVFLLLMLFAYVDLSYAFGTHEYQAAGVLSLLEVVLFTITLLSAISLLLATFRFCVLNNTSGTLTVLEKAIFYDKYIIKRCISISDINDVVIADAQITRADCHYKGCFDLLIKDKDENIVYSKAYAGYHKRIAENDADAIKSVIAGDKDSFELTEYDCAMYENIFIGIIIFQLLVNVNHIKHLLFGAFM